MTNKFIELDVELPKPPKLSKPSGKTYSDSTHYFQFNKEGVCFRTGRWGNPIPDPKYITIPIDTLRNMEL